MGLGYLRQLRPPGRLTLRQRAAGAVLALLALVAPVPALAQAESDTAIADARASILQPGAMAKTQDMDFGTIARPTVAGTVTMTPAGACGTSAGILHMNECQPAEFDIMGRKNWLVRIRNQSGNSIPLTGPGGATMTLTNLTIGVTDMTVNPGGPNPPGTFGRYQIDSDSGVASFRIGGRLNINANQAPGTYTGSYVIQVLFQ